MNCAREIFGAVYDSLEGSCGLCFNIVSCLFGDQAEADTDEVFAQLTLMPETNVRRPVLHNVHRYMLWISIF